MWRGALCVKWAATGARAKPVKKCCALGSDCRGSTLTAVLASEWRLHARRALGRKASSGGGCFRAPGECGLVGRGREAAAYCGAQMGVAWA